MIELWKTIQSHLGIPADGIPGEKTAAAIAAALKLETAPTLPPVTSNEFSDRTEKVLSSLIPQVQPQFRALLAVAKSAAARHGLTVEAISGMRSYAAQTELYAQGRTKPGRVVTNAKAGYSNHNFGVAVDLGLFRGRGYIDSDDPTLANQVYAEIAANAPSQIAWGGYWKMRDTPHFEYKTGLTMAQMRERVAAGKSVV